MKMFLFAAMTAVFLPTLGFAQHADVEFGFDDFTNPTAILVESAEFTSDNIGIAEGEFEPPLFPGDDIEADDPGFITPADEGLRVNPGDEISVRFIDASQNSAAGAGFVSFFNPNTGQLESSGNIGVSNQFGDSITLDGANTTLAQSIFLSEGSDGSEFRADGTPFSNAPEEDDNEVLGVGEIHNHLVFGLDPGAETGAFGLLVQFEADFADIDGNVDGEVDLTSDPFFLIFNNGLDDAVFEDQAVAAFSVAVPEPSAAIVLSAIAGGILTRRRRRA